MDNPSPLLLYEVTDELSDFVCFATDRLTLLLYHIAVFVCDVLRYHGIPTN
jgi:hypothetical protein